MRVPNPVLMQGLGSNDQFTAELLKGISFSGCILLCRRSAIPTLRPAFCSRRGRGSVRRLVSLQLAKRGAKVTLLDAWGPGNSRASSGGETRVIRTTYGPERLYTQMATRALQLWQENEQRWNLKIFFRTGVLWMAGRDDSYERAAMPLMKEAGASFERLSSEDCSKRWPQINFEDVSWSIYEPDSGYLAARRGCEAVLNAFLKEGGAYRQTKATPGPVVDNRMQGITVTSDEVLNADSY